MSEIYDNWERLVAATLKKQQLWELFHAPSRTPSISEASDTTSSSRLYEEPPNLVLLSDFSPAFDVKYVRMASAELIGKGTFGDAYSALLDIGVRIVVKRLKLGNVSELDFKHHMNIVGNVNHVNVAPLRAYYASGNERVLLYDYYNNGSVYTLLHGQNHGYVSWVTRKQIMVDVARALVEIHEQNYGKLVHGNVKSSNVFHSPKTYYCLSDVGLANMIETKFVSSSRCHAPEVKSSKDVSQVADIYGFGVLLLELLTRKSSVHVPGGPEAVDLVKLVRSKKASQVIDPDLWHDSTIRDGMLAEILEIGIKCVAKSVKKRPQMLQVLKMLEDASVIIPRNPSPVEQTSVVFLEDSIPRFYLEELLSADAEVLGKGTFGTSYKAILKSGHVVVVKRLKDVVVDESVFQEQMKIFGRMKHKNVADIMGYIYSKDEKLVLYRDFGETNISALLHGKRGHGRKALDWKTRLNIATGVGMGIAHIHGKDAGELVHGNIKSSNVFLVEPNHVILSETGYAKLKHPINLRGKHRWYHAPEVKHTRQVSQASDVYSFGVFLIELGSGVPPQHVADDGNIVSIVEWFQSVARDDWIDQVLDKELLRHRRGDEDTGIVRYLETAMSCLNREPWRRPRMLQVVKMLEEISGHGINSKWEDDTVEDEWLPSIEWRLENLLLDALLKMAP